MSKKTQIKFAIKEFEALLAHDPNTDLTTYDKAEHRLAELRGILNDMEHPNQDRTRDE